MFTGILFNKKIFEEKEEMNLMDPMTTNMIVICESPKIKNLLLQELKDICDGKCEEEGEEVSDYCTGAEKKGDFHVPKLKMLSNYLPTARLSIDDEQLITLTVEAPFLYTAKDAKDIWFAAEGANGKISVYPMTVFKGYKEVWANGLDDVYHHVVTGRYGAYNGYWMESRVSDKSKWSCC